MGRYRSIYRLGKKEFLMRLLILTQRMNDQDPVLGFFVEWVREFSKHFEHVLIIALEVGTYDLPENVEVLSLGKEDGKGRSVRLLRFYSYIWKRRDEYETVFVHMNQIYVVLGGIFWRILGKKIGLWYTHRSVTVTLRVAEILVHHIFSASQESFRLKSKKLILTGHAIDTESFAPSEDRVSQDIPQIITIGRLSPSKCVETIIRAVEILKQQGKKIHLDIIGVAGTPEQKEYETGLKEYVESHHLKKEITFLGAVPHQKISEILKDSSIFINMSKTGSLDKAGLEAMASGIPVITSNEAFCELLGPYKEQLYVENEPHILADKIQDLLLSDTVPLCTHLRAAIKDDHSFRNTIKRISAILS